MWAQAWPSPGLHLMARNHTNYALKKMTDRKDGREMKFFYVKGKIYILFRVGKVKSIGKKPFLFLYKKFIFLFPTTE